MGQESEMQYGMQMKMIPNLMSKLRSAARQLQGTLDCGGLPSLWGARRNFSLYSAPAPLLCVWVLLIGRQGTEVQFKEKE